MDKSKKYRPNVAAVILSATYPLDCKILVAQRADIAGAWQFPQGGIDSGEEPREALLRELKEEIGTDEVEILAEHPEWLSYDFPPNLIASKMTAFAGQTQKYFLVRLKPHAKVDINTQNPEFNDYKFIPSQEIVATVNHFKKPVYIKVLKHFKEEGYI